MLSSLFVRTKIRKLHIITPKPLVGRLIIDRRFNPYVPNRVQSPFPKIDQFFKEKVYLLFKYRKSVQNGRLKFNFESESLLHTLFL